MPHPIHHKLKLIPLFHDFTDTEIEAFLELTDPTAFDAGEIVVRQGEPGNCMYYVAEGTCRVVAKRGGNLVDLAHLGPGDIFGELALFDHQPRSADVQATTNCILLKCNEGVLRALSGVYPAAAFKFLLGTVREIGDRLRKANQRYLDTILGPPAGDLD
jgi:CRP/FNR family transcriptional regulator, cyclic AMP receptor protein